LLILDIFTFFYKKFIFLIEICKIKIDDSIIDENNESIPIEYFSKIVILNDNSTINFKCKKNDSIIKTTFQQQESISNIDVKCNNELRSLNLVEYKCLDACNVNYLLNLMKNEENIGKFYPINPLNQFFLNHESIRFYCNSLEYDRKVILFECLNSKWYFASKNELIFNKIQLIQECIYDQETPTVTSTSEFSNIDFYFKKNFKSLLNLKLNLKLFLIILLITSSLIILFLMLLLGITFYKRYRLTNYYRSLFTSSNSNGRFSLLNNLTRRPQQQNQSEQQEQNFRRRYEDQLTIGSSSSLNNNNLIIQNLNLPSYDEAVNKPTQQQQLPPIETTSATILNPQPSPPPSFSTILKETSNLQTRNDNDSQSNYSSISAAVPNNNKKIKQLRFGSINSHHYLNNQQNFYDSNETFSLNGGLSSSIAASAITTSENCTIITNDSTESKFVLRGSFDNNIDQTSLLNYSTSLSDAILTNQEGKN
jgi:hypothetical protein